MIRTKNSKGVTIPSQIRYILYFEKAIANNWTLETFPIKHIQLTKIKLITCPKFSVNGGCDPWFRISCPYEESGSKIKYISKKHQKIKNFKGEAFIEFTFDNPVELSQDVLIQFFNKNKVMKDSKMFQFWMNCTFFEGDYIMSITKPMLEFACKDKKHKKFQKEFRVEIHAQNYRNIDQQSQVLFRENSKDKEEEKKLNRKLSF